jgi:hypothetical protein
MKDFDAKWQALAARVRETSEALDERLPLGFTTRVLARAFRRPSKSLGGLWERMALGSLAGVLALLLICAAFELPHLRDAQPLDPRIGNTVAQLVWAL